MAAKWSACHWISTTGRTTFSAPPGRRHKSPAQGSTARLSACLVTGTDEALHDVQCLLADMVLHSLGIDARRLVANAQCPQELQHNSMALARHCRHRLT